MQGKVKFFNEAKGYGFITQDDGGGEVFVHRTDFPPDVATLAEGQTVTFDIEQSPRGLRAVKVAVVDVPASRRDITDELTRVSLEFFLPLSVKPLDDPSFDPGETVIMDSDAANIATVSNREFALAAVHAINTHRLILKCLVQAKDETERLRSANALMRAALEDAAKFGAGWPKSTYDAVHAAIANAKTGGAQ